MRSVAPDPSGIRPSPPRCGQNGYMTDIAPLIRQRWSPKQFDPHHVVSGRDIKLLLEAARWAPSARNRQPWRFIFASRGDATWERIRPYVVGHSDWALDAGLWVVNIYDSWIKEFDLALYDLGATVTVMSLQAEALGLHARQFASFDRPQLSREFGIEEPHTAVTITAIGAVPEGVREEGRTRLDPEELLWPLG